MNENFNELLKKFKEIASKRWVKSIYNGHGNISMTFEWLIGKKNDDNFTPDYKDIELKCTTRYSNYPISLFSLTFDGPTNKEIIRLNELYGNI